MARRCTQQASHESTGPAILEVIGGDPAIYRVGLPGVTPELGYFITPWVIVERAGNRTMVVDPGAAATVPHLVSSLESLGVSKVDYVLLTHAHIDHMGGLGRMLDRYPEAMVLCSARGHAHLIDPTRLMRASIQTLGSLAVAYGQIDPVSEARILPEGAGVDGFEMIETPGHASHHVCFVYGIPGNRVLFAGEAAGIHSQEPASGGDGPYLRPATPPRFFYDTYADSLRKMSVLDVSMICYGHLGFSSEARLLMSLHLGQLALWREVIARTLREEGVLGTRPTEAVIEKAFQALLSEDRLLSRFHSFRGGEREREEAFAKNSILGFAGYLQSPV